ncbi:MAG: DUF167 domain-containing protein [Chlorobiaceae bacterium]|nr:DUF167 domain-containing protein [Chlorobiales bacterium]NTV26566.1 DUF167 domain-containing protein [Chlorobiaceae bacterium]
MAAITQKGDGACLSIRVQPRSSRSGVAGMYGESIRICLKSAPVDDAANQECCQLLSKILGVPKSNVTVQSGRTSRSKILRVDGLTASAVGEILAPYLETSVPPAP